MNKESDNWNFKDTQLAARKLVAAIHTYSMGGSPEILKHIQVVHVLVVTCSQMG